MTEKQRDIATSVTVDENSGHVTGLSTHDYAEHDIDKRAGQFVEQGQYNQQHIYLDFRAEVEAMSVEQRIKATTAAILQIQAEFVHFESRVTKLIEGVLQIEKMVTRMHLVVIFLGSLIGVLCVLVIAFWVYFSLHQH